MALARGEQFVELAAKDPTKTGADAVNFYLFRFEQACNAAPGRCSHGDLFTPSIESGFTGRQLRPQMPPKRFRELSAAEADLVTAELSK